MYAGGRPLWQLSIGMGWRTDGGLRPLVRWTARNHREAEEACARIFRGVGTDEALIEPEGEELAMLQQTRQWRKPLRIDEVTRMARTPEVLQRPGRA